MKRPASGTAGQGLVEYALILALVVIIAVVVLVFFGPQLAWALSLIGTEIDKSG
jgi:Flp pilus assembly pilin Flp